MVSWTFDAKVVGAHLTFQGSAEAGTTAQRLDDACQCASRVMSLPLGFDRRASVLRGLVLPKGMYGCSVNHLTPQMLARLRTASFNALDIEHVFFHTFMGFYTNLSKNPRPPKKKRSADNKMAPARPPEPEANFLSRGQFFFSGGAGPGISM